MHLHLSISSLGALIAGVLILFLPNLTRFLVGLYLILVGVLGVLGLGGHRIF